MYRSPAGPPRGPALPFPGTRRRAPSATPAGTCTLICSVTASVPSARQAVQGRCRCRPEPSHAAQAFENTMWPRRHCVAPLPWHGAHLRSAARRMPLPAHAAQASSRVTVNCRTAPRSDSSKASVISPCRSPPASGPAPPDVSGSSSENSSPNVADAPETGVEKSNPRNSTDVRRAAGPGSPCSSYACRRSGLRSVWYASVTRRKNAAASLSPGLMSG